MRAMADELALSAGLLLLFTALILLALGGNLLVCAAVYVDRNLRRQPENLFLVSLAVSDLFVSALVMVFAAANDLLGYWPFGRVCCQLWVCFDITCCTASILNLCAIALDRYWHISRPMAYVSRTRVMYGIVVVWFSSAIIGFAQMAFGFAQQQKESYKAAQLHLRSHNGSLPSCELLLRPLYAVGSSMCSFFLPATVMVLLYTRLYLYARKHARSIRTQLKLATSFLIMQLASEKIREVRSVHRIRALFRVNNVTGTTVNNDRLIGHCSADRNANTLSAEQICPTAQSNCSKQSSKGILNSVMRCFCRETKKDTSENAISNVELSAQHNRTVSDQKARLTLGVIMGTFLICWLPFFIVNVVRSLVPDAVSETQFQAVTWLGYANSTANPLIYSILNRDFRRAFKKILSRVFSCSHLSTSSDDSQGLTRTRAAEHEDTEYHCSSNAFVENNGNTKISFTSEDGRRNNGDRFPRRLSIHCGPSPRRLPHNHSASAQIHLSGRCASASCSEDVR